MAGTRVTFHLDRAGVSRVLKYQAAPVVHEMARKLAERVRAQLGDDVEVTVETYTTDRAAAEVTIADSRGTQMQATGGALTRAAASLGLDVNPR